MDRTKSEDIYRERMSMDRPLRTSEISKAVGVHANTVRLYEEWGFLPPIPRSASGYRQFSTMHLEQMRLARIAFREPYGGRRIRRSARVLVGALILGEKHLKLARSELDQTRAAADYLERWATGEGGHQEQGPFVQRGQAAKLLDVTAETLRHWERNGLIDVPRDPKNNYRRYGTAEIDRLRVLRLLTRAGYSTMAVLRMTRQLDQGRREDLGQVLDTPEPEEDLLYATDRWLSTLTDNEARARELLVQLQKMVKLQSY